jgi:hypothetical protein
VIGWVDQWSVLTGQWSMFTGLRLGLVGRVLGRVGSGLASLARTRVKQAGGHVARLGSCWAQFMSAAHGGLGGVVLWTTKRVHGGPHPRSCLLSMAHGGPCAPSCNGAR